MREKRFFVAFTPASEPGEGQREHGHSPSPIEPPRRLQVTCSSESEQHDWIRDCAWQEQRHRGQQARLGDAVCRAIRALRL